MPEIREVSCIIITHERDELLAESLRSVLDQTTSRRFETVVVDDCSREQTRLVVAGLAAEYPDRAVRYESAHPALRGASASRNVGARLARSPVLAFLDDDDIWESTYLEDACTAMEDSGSDLAITWMKVLERDGHVAPLLRMPEGLGVRDCLARNRGMTGSNLVISARAFWSIGGFDERLPVSNDKDLLVRFLAAGWSYSVVARDNAVHRRHHGPQLTRPDERRAAGLLQYLEKHNSLMSAADRRYVLRSVHAIRRRTARGSVIRAGHGALAVLYLSPRDVVRRLGARRAPEGRYRSV